MKDDKNTETLKASAQAVVRCNFSYDDMLKAFIAGRKHMKECGDTNKACWDLSTWIKENYT